MNESWWYWAAAVFFAALCSAPYACMKWQEWSDRRDREAWEAMHR